MDNIVGLNSVQVRGVHYNCVIVMAFTTYWDNKESVNKLRSFFSLKPFLIE